jgi:methyl-accepting chemotaxis protein
MSILPRPRRTEREAANQEETTAALGDIMKSVRGNADSAEHARRLASTAQEDAEHSGVDVTDAINAMSTIETSSRQIGNIIGVIDEIAFQTNLLALNAGGEAGCGFAVVATEVRALAQRSAVAANEINSAVEQMDQLTQQNAAMVEEATAASHALSNEAGALEISSIAPL